MTPEEFFPMTKYPMRTRLSGELGYWPSNASAAALPEAGQPSS
jgi:hypothetical protein